MGHVVVVGSLNCDLVMRVPRLPAPGETMGSGVFATFVGGKGCNQAIACARAGAEVHMFGRVGADSFAEQILGALGDAGVRAEHVARDPHARTGVASIFVAEGGENMICVAPEANAGLGREALASLPAALDGATALLLSLEVPLETVVVAAELASRCGVRVVLNPAPAPAGPLPNELLSCVDVLIPNRVEAARLSSRGLDEDAAALAASLLALGPRAVVLTLGGDGALLAGPKGHELFAPFRVTAVDTTGAGDAFCGALTARLAAGTALSEAVRFGCAAGALACTKPGAEPSLPTQGDIDQLLFG